MGKLPQLIFWLRNRHLIVVPDCHPKTSKKKESGNETYITSPRNQHDSTWHLFRSVNDRRYGQVRCFSSHNSSQEHLKIFLSQFRLEFICPHLYRPEQAVRLGAGFGWLGVGRSICVSVSGREVENYSIPIHQTHSYIKVATGLNVFMLWRTKLSVSARPFFPTRVKMLNKWIFWEFTCVSVKSCLLE
jgi:hypothetical protein